MKPWTNKYWNIIIVCHILFSHLEIEFKNCRWWPWKICQGHFFQFFPVWFDDSVDFNSLYINKVFTHNADLENGVHCINLASPSRSGETLWPGEKVLFLIRSLILPNSTRHQANFIFLEPEGTFFHFLKYPPARNFLFIFFKQSWPCNLFQYYQ